MLRVLVITPTYNEIENLAAFTHAVFATLPHAELLVVDDASPDGTGELAEALAKANARVHVLHRKAKQGLGRAYVAGFKWALARSYDRILQMDTDFSHDPADLPRMLEVSQNAELVIGSRYKGGVRVLNWPLRRLMLSYGAGIYVRLLTRMPIMDPTAGFKCFHREALASLDLNAIAADGYGFQIEVNHALWRKRFRIAEHPVIFPDRTAGTSKMSLAIAWEAVLLVFKLAFCRR